MINDCYDQYCLKWQSQNQVFLKILYRLSTPILVFMYKNRLSCKWSLKADISNFSFFNATKSGAFEKEHALAFEGLNLTVQSTNPWIQENKTTLSVFHLLIS